MTEPTRSDMPAIPEQFKRLLRDETLAVLGTTGEKGPHVCLIFFAVDSDFSWLYFATNRETLKFKNLSAEPRVSLLLDDRGGRASDGKGYALTLNGKASVMEGEGAECASSKLLAKNGAHGATVDARNCAYIKIELQTGNLVSSDGEHLLHDFGRCGSPQR